MVANKAQQQQEVLLQGRDLAIVNLVARFQQVASRHVHEILFPNNLSYTPSDRALRRLTQRGWLARIDIRIVGGRRGGSGQYVYQLGRRGFYAHHEGRYIPAKAIRFHTIAVVDSFVELLRLQRSGVINIVGLSTEPDCHAVVGGVQLKPDMYADIARTSGERLKLWLEVDMGTEAQRQLRGKLESYWRAYNDADVAQWPVFPRVLWIAIDDERSKELRWLIEQGPQDAQMLFQVTTKGQLHTLFL